MFPLLLTVIQLALAGAAAPPSAGGYADAVARIEHRQAADDSVVAPGARSILISRGQRTPRVFLLLHGFTDSPRQFAALGALLAAGGDNVLIPRLPHHADRARGVRALADVRADELYAFGDSVADEAAGLGDTVVVIGLSAGGVIAAALAQHRTDIARVVLIAPSVAPNGLSEEDTHGLIELAGRLPSITRSQPVDSTRPDYRQGISTKGLAQLMRLGQRVLDDSDLAPPSVKRITVLLNENDHTVSDEAATELARRWSDNGAVSVIYQFPASQKLPHNVMEETSRGGNLELVHPVLQALAYGRVPPDVVRYRWVRCPLDDCS